jgi:hypothetical protein
MARNFLCNLALVEEFVRKEEMGEVDDRCLQVAKEALAFVTQKVDTELKRRKVAVDDKKGDMKEPTKAELKEKLEQNHSKIEQLMGYKVSNYMQERSPHRHSNNAELTSFIQNQHATPNGTMCSEAYNKVMQTTVSEIHKIKDEIYTKKESLAKLKEIQSLQQAFTRNMPQDEAQIRAFENALRQDETNLVIKQANLYHHLANVQPIDKAGFRSKLDVLINEKTELLMQLRVMEVAQV